MGVGACWDSWRRARGGGTLARRSDRDNARGGLGGEKGVGGAGRRTAASGLGTHGGGEVARAGS